MKSDENVLVIAADATLRRSLAFLLEAEGYAVSAHDSVPLVSDTTSPRRRCAVVDDGSMEGGRESWDRLARLAETIVLLMSRAREFPADMPVHVVEKPLLGETLVNAVKAALRQPAASGTPASPLPLRSIP